MSSESSQVDQNAIKVFQETWSFSICEALKQSSREEFESRVLDSDPISAKNALAGVWARFAAAGQLAGEIGLFVSGSDALLLSRLLAGKPADEATELSDDLRNVLAEFCRRLAGIASSAFAPKASGEVELRFRDLAPPSWEGAVGFRLEVCGTQTPSLHFRVIADENWAQSASAAFAAGRPPLPGSALDRLTPPPRATAQEPDNIRLLLHLELEATLRFGEREMLLRDILNLTSGSVVELNHRVNEPVELLVRGIVVAKGDVVVLDGNYGLRVTQIASPADRMNSLRI